MTVMVVRLARLFLGTALACLSLTANAHLLNMSNARVDLGPDATVYVQLELDLLRTVGSRAKYFELSERPDPMSDPEIQALLSALPAAVELELGEVIVPLQLTDVRFPDATESEFLDPLNWPRASITLQGQLTAADTASADNWLQARFTDQFFFEEPIATSIIDMRSGINQTRWIVTGQRSPAFDAALWLDRPPSSSLQQTARPTPFWSYLWAGITHILPGGIDHLLFVAGLFLLAQSMRQLLVTVSVFTFAHSATLIFGALGWVQISPWIVEPVILASIVWVGISNLRGGQRSHHNRWLVFAFGLLHGLGFAGALRDLELPAEQTLTALIAFNVGVEFGQIVFLLLVASAFAITFAIARRLPTDAGGRSLLPVETRTRRYGGMVLVAAPLLLAVNAFV